LLPYILVKHSGWRLHHTTLSTIGWPEGAKQDGAMVKEGKLKCREEIVEGCEEYPKAFIALLEGKNTGKMLVKL